MGVELGENEFAEPAELKRRVGLYPGTFDPVTLFLDPHLLDDTVFDLIDDALTTLAERRGAWLGDDLTAITLIASLIDQAERCLPQLVHDARANGHSWHQIAQALATSPDQARLRFDPQSPVADSRWPYDWLPEPPHQRPQPPRPHPPLHANPYLALHASSYADRWPR